MSSCQCSQEKNFTVKEFRLDDFYLPSIVSKLSLEENEYRHNIFEKILEGKSVFQNEKIIDLEQRNILACQDDKVISIYPLSVNPTDKEVHFNGRKAYAMCALDAIGFAFVFDTEVTIYSKLKDTGQSFVLKANQEGCYLQSQDIKDIYVLYPDLRDCDSWSSHCCLHMNFFSSIEAIEEYIKQNGLEEASIIGLNLEQSFIVSKWIFDEKN